MPIAQIVALALAWALKLAKVLGYSNEEIKTEIERQLAAPMDSDAAWAEYQSHLPDGDA